MHAKNKFLKNRARSLSIMMLILLDFIGFRGCVIIFAHAKSKFSVDSLQGPAYLLSRNVVCKVVIKRIPINTINYG